MDLLESPQPARAWVARVFTTAEDVIYVGLGILLAGISFILLISGLISFGQNLMAGSLVANIVGLLDRFNPASSRLKLVKLKAASSSVVEMIMGTSADSAGAAGSNG